MISHISKLKSIILALIIVVAATSFTCTVLPQAIAAPGDYTITYINGSTTYAKSYAPGSTVTLDSLPSGAIAWTDDSSAAAPNGKMAYVNYSHTETVNGVSTPITIPMTLTINGNMTLTANYGSYATGQGPRLVQFHLELKYMDMTNNMMMQYEQHYNNINAPAGYYIVLPPANYFGNSLYANVNSAGGLSNTGQSISDWVSDGSYTGTTTPPSTSIFTPNTLIYVDPNNYNMVYNAMVTPSTPAPAASPETITFRISQTDIPPSTVCEDFIGYSAMRTCGGAFWMFWDDNQSGAALRDAAWPAYLYWLGYSGQTQLSLSNLQASTPWDSAFPLLTDNATYAMVPMPQAVVYPNYTFFWTMDGVRLTTDIDSTTYPGYGIDNTIANYLNSAGVSPTDPIGGSHVFVLQYVPVPVPVQLYVDGHYNSVVYDGAPHTVAGYDVYNCTGVANIDPDNVAGSGCTALGSSAGGGPVTLPNGDVLNFANTSGNSNVTVTGTEVGTYPITLVASDFSVANTSGDLYNLTMSNGGLTITQKELPIVVTPPIDPGTPGDQTVVVTPSNPGDLPPGQVIITPGTGITNNGDGTSTTDGNTNVVVNVDGDGNITYTDPKTGNVIPYDPTQPNGGIIWIGDTGNNDPSTGLPSNVTNNYQVGNIFPPNMSVPQGNLPQTGTSLELFNLSQVLLAILVSAGLAAIVVVPTALTRRK